MKELNSNTKRFLIGAAPYWIIAFIVVGAGIMIVETLYPPSPFVWGWDRILKILAICAGLGWIIHGTGFLLVRVN